MDSVFVGSVMIATGVLSILFGLWARAYPEINRKLPRFSWGNPEEAATASLIGGPLMIVLGAIVLFDLLG